MRRTRYILLQKDLAYTNGFPGNLDPRETSYKDGHGIMYSYEFFSKCYKRIPALNLYNFEIELLDEEDIIPMDPRLSENAVKELIDSLNLFEFSSQDSEAMHLLADILLRHRQFDLIKPLKKAFVDLKGGEFKFEEKEQRVFKKENSKFLRFKNRILKKK